MSILSETYDQIIPGTEIVDIRQFHFGSELQKHTRHKFFRFPECSAAEHVTKIRQLLQGTDAVLLYSPQTWIGLIKQFMILRPGQQILLRIRHDIKLGYELIINVFRTSLRKSHTLETVQLIFSIKGGVGLFTFTERSFMVK